MSIDLLLYLVAFILFVIATILRVVPSKTSVWSGAFVAAGLAFSALSKTNMTRLRDLLDVQMRDGYLRDTFRAGKVTLAKSEKAGDVADIRCTAWYFKGRQARQCVTFERGGFIGFAGWSDDTNIQPILRAFIAWVNELATAPVAATEEH